MIIEKLDLEKLKRTVEAILFVSSSPISKKDLKRILALNGNINLLDKAINELILEYNNSKRGIFIREVAGGYQIATREEYGEIIQKLFQENKKRNLTPQALETLAIIAYKQPITSAEISNIRGKNSANAIKTLLEHNLIKISGRKKGLGRPFLYSTTKEFLIKFGMKDLSDLPKINEISEYFDLKAKKDENGQDTKSYS